MDFFDFGDDPVMYRDNTPPELSDLLDLYLTTATNRPETEYDVASSTVGSEYELADIPRTQTPTDLLPLGLSWDGKDQTVMNSNGVATDPSLDASKRTWQFGGELNTKPCDSIDEIVDLYKSLLDKFPETTVNNSCNLHNHFRVPGLDLNGLKRVIAYYYVYREEMIEISDYIPTPTEQGFDPINTAHEDMKLLTKRHAHHTNASKGTRHGDLEEYVTIFKLKAQTEEEFQDASCYNKAGEKKKSWAIAARAALNTLQTRRSDKSEFVDLPYEERPYAESGTIEFRMHHGTVDLDKYRNTLQWDINILHAALNTGDTPTEVFNQVFGGQTKEDVFPPYISMDPELYRIFKDTKNDDSTKRRDEVKARIKNMQAEGKI